MITPIRSAVAIACFSLLFFNACRKEFTQPTPHASIAVNTTQQIAPVKHIGGVKALYSGFPETMESGTKAAYASADVVLNSGTWNFNDALIGTLSTDRKNGTKSARLQNIGMLTMQFNNTSGISTVSIAHAVFGTDASSTWALYFSTDNGSTWTKTGNTVSTTSTSLNTATFTLNQSGVIRLQLRKLSGGRLNIDDISISDYQAIVYPDNDNYLTMGNPSGAVTNTSFPNNYLLVKTEYTLAYNNARGSAAWVGWHLYSNDLGSAARCDCFAQDAQLPATFFRASSTSYSGSGFDRGHQCPSADRTSSSTANAATFLMSNMLPQAPNLNQITWSNLEAYERTLVNQGNEVYCYAGGYGSGGTGSNGGVTTTINSGSITVPSRCWKVILIIPNGSNDVNRVSSSTRIIAVDFPNTQTVNVNSWGFYRTSVDAIESATGYNLFSNLPINIQNTIESVVDNGPTQ